ncbi:MAG: NADP-dependent oxidoreductase [Bacteroidota bacterium]|nr:NADP-dependent oxidoreductase [Bacteroidota bacterium]
MKAVYINEFGGRDKLLYSEDFPKPEVKEGEVLVRIRAASINPVDRHIREGHLAKMFPHHFPLILGWDMAGVVEETGHSARRFAVGDNVYAYARRPFVENGTYAEYISLPESYLASMPQSLTFEESASVPLTGLTAYQALYEKGKICEKQVVLILGASGGVGSMAVQMARIAETQIIALAGSSNAAYLKELGADEALNYDQEDWVERFNALVPEKADLVFDCSGGTTLSRAHYCVKPGGTLVSIAGQANPALVASLKIQFAYHFVEPNSLQLEQLATMLNSHKLKTHLNTILPLEETAKAHELIETGHTRGKIVLSIP